MLSPPASLRGGLENKKNTLLLPTSSHIHDIFRTEREEERGRERLLEQPPLGSYEYVELHLNWQDISQSRISLSPSLSRI
jgi:hypothetical protein